MKIIRYKFLSEDVLIDKEFRCSADILSANEEIVKREAYNGEYTIEDDGQPEHNSASTDDVLNTMLGVE